MWRRSSLPVPRGPPRRRGDKRWATARPSSLYRGTVERYGTTRSLSAKIIAVKEHELALA